MKQTKIDWCDCTINPVVGCPRGCTYCYAKKLNARFGWVADFSKPQFFPDRLAQLSSKTPKSIFINSMSDIAFWTPNQLKETIAAMLKNNQHKYIALTKDFMKYLTVFMLAVGRNYPILSKIRGLLFVGETITTQDDIRFETINGIPVSTDFINIEPILAPINLDDKLSGDTAYELIIIGAETGNRKGKIIPSKQWIDDIVTQADKHHIKVFMKESLRAIMSNDFRQDGLIWSICSEGQKCRKGIE